MILHLLTQHFRRHCQRSPMQCSLWLGFEGVAITLPVALLLSLGGFAVRTDLNQLNAFQFLVVAVLVAPVLETFLFQLIPIVCMRWLRLPFAGQVGVSMFLFFMTHWLVSASSGLSAGLIGGFYFALHFAYRAEQSAWTAYKSTVVQHMIWNGVLFLFGLFAGGFSEQKAWMPDWLAYTLVIQGTATYGACLWLDSSRQKQPAITKSP